MPKKNLLKPIRRCITCKNKSRRTYWRDGTWGDKRCPICGAVAGYRTTDHGGDSEVKIAEKRGKTIEYLLQLEEDRKISQEQEERLNWLQQKHQQWLQQKKKKQHKKR